MSLGVSACSDAAPAPSADPAAGGGSASPPPKAQPWTVVTWNVRNLVNDVIDDTDAPYEEADPGYAAHRGAVGRVLAPIDADLVVLQEVEHARVAEELVAQELDGRYPHVAHVDGNDPRGIDVVMLSKAPFDRVVSHRETWFSREGTSAPDYRFSRDALEVHLTVHGQPLVVIGVHFKAKNDDDPDKRLAEAQQSRSIADGHLEASPDTPMLILGDYNDTPASAPWLAIEDASSPYGRFSPATRDLPPSERFSYVYAGEAELVDHQMMSDRLAPLLTRATILHGDEVDEASDHAPVVATYAFP